MKISEILDPKNNRADALDALNVEVVRLDRIFDTTYSITNGFNIPVEFLNNSLVDETRQVLQKLNNRNMPAKWQEKLSVLIEYFG